MLQLIYPLLYGIYLILGLFALQPYQDIGLSPAGATCLFILGSGLATFVMAVGTSSGSLKVSWDVFRRIGLVSLLQVIGIGGFIAGLLTGSGFLFSVMALLYGTVAGTVWARFVRSRSFSALERVGVITASLTVAVCLVLNFSNLGLESEGIPVWGPHTMVSRALSLSGALLWGVGHFAFDPRRFSVGRSAWSFWESLCAVSAAILLSAGLKAWGGSSHPLTQGFEDDLILTVPFVLFGVVFGALRSRLVHSWEPKLSARAVQLAWVSGAVLAALFCGLLVLPVHGMGFEVFGVVALAGGIALTRTASREFSNYRGPRKVVSTEH